MRNSEFGQPAVTLDLPAGGSSIVGSQSARTTVDDGMNIGAVAERSGVPAKSIRYYESIGLIRPAERRANGYRSYSRNEMQTLAFIEQARRLGFSVDEVRDLLDLWRDRRRKSVAVKKLVAHHLERLERKIGELQAMQKTLADLAQRCRGDARPGCPILEDLEPAR